jgi:phosphoribosylglycinamide formyltransferase-1
MSGFVGVLVSGTGTNLQALLDAQARGELAPAQVALVISNNPGAMALDRAAAAGVRHVVIDHRRFADRAAFEQEMLDALASAEIDAIVLAGFMRVLTAHFVSRFPNRIINTHPALCPAFPGLNDPEQALAAGVKVTGCTIHFVDTGVDTGPIIAQAAVEVLPGDDVRALHDRIRVQEHRLLPMAVRMLAQGRLRVDGRVVRVLTPELT